MSEPIDTRGKDEIPGLLAALLGVESTEPGEWAVPAVAREPNIYTSTFRSEIVTFRWEDGRELKSLVKRGGDPPIETYGHKRGVPYESRIYRELLPAARTRVPRVFAAGTDPRSGDSVLCLEYLGANGRITQSAEPDVLSLAAEWLAELHAADLPGRQCLTYVTRYTRAYYAGWVRRALRFAIGDPRYGTLGAICRRFLDELGSLLSAQQCLVHGEFYPSNIAIVGRDVYGIDWESAAIAPGEVDLASLTEGWDDDSQREACEAYTLLRYPGLGVRGAWPLLDLARIYTHLRWLGDQPERTARDLSTRLDAMAVCAARLGWSVHTG